MALKSGSYEIKTEKSVVVWPAPDKDGDGEPVWVDVPDDFGNIVDRIEGVDKDDNPIRSYNPPKGFANRPGYDNTDNYVRVNERGIVQRQANGEAICIKPGQALVFHPNGSIETLSGQYAQRLFELAHEQTDVSEDVED